MSETEQEPQVWTTIPADNPIKDAAEDTLGRAAIAGRFAEEILAQDVSEGMVVGVLGAWGSGKTSFVNLARERIAERGGILLDFNPWMFSGAEQLVAAFFVELAAQLKLRPGLGAIGDGLEQYGEAFSGLGWLPVVGAWIERGRLVNRALSKFLQRQKEGVGARRVKIETALAKLENPIVVVLDDIDRLATSEVRDVFKLVRLTASFPNVIYILAFDRVRVELALAEEGVPGRDYLEKILQLAIDLPAVPEHVLTRQIFTELDAALSSIERPGTLDEHVWPDVFMEIVRPLIRNMRDVRRYAVAARGTVAALDGEIALADVLALEAVRTFLPDVFVKMPSAIAGLTTPSPSFGGADPPALKKQISELLEGVGERESVVAALVARLFPAAQRHLPRGTHYGADWTARWLRDRRVAHEEILRLYLERVAGQRLEAFRDAERAWATMGDEQALDSLLRSLDRARLEDVIGSLETFESEFRPEHVVPATTVLLNLLPELPERPRGMLDMDARLVVGRVVYRLLRVIEDPVAVEQAVSAILPRLKSLSSKLELITDIGYREGAGHKLATEDAARRFEASWRAEVRASSAEQLAQELDLGRVLLLTKRDAGPSEDPLTIPPDTALTLALLRSARSDVRSQSLGSRAVRRFPRLAWDLLIELYGDEATLRERIEALKVSKGANDEAAELIELADRYANGWRPKDFGDE